VNTFNFGLSDIGATFFMNAYYDKQENQGAFRICEKSEASTGIYIECKKADDLGIKNIGYIKIDVEGHELKALIGMNDIIKQYKPLILIEIHDSSPTKEDVLKFLEAAHYTQHIRLSHCDYLFLNK
jgi:FkbM family methyltransferase